MVPGVQAGGVAVGPGDFEGVVADVTELRGGDVGGDPRRIEQFAAGEFVDAGRARAFASQLMEGHADERAAGPLQFEAVVLSDSSDGRGCGGHAGILAAGSFQRKDVETPVCGHSRGGGNPEAGNVRRRKVSRETRAGFPPSRE